MVAMLRALPHWPCSDAAGITGFLGGLERTADLSRPWLGQESLAAEPLPVSIRG
jgi:hypothetical protein